MSEQARDVLRWYLDKIRECGAASGTRTAYSGSSSSTICQPPERPSLPMMAATIAAQRSA
jgi:hypothetical protein